MRAVIAFVLALALLVAACGAGPAATTTTGDTTSTTTTIPGPEYDPDQVILRIDTAGGFVPYEIAVVDVPEVILMGDGRLIITEAGTPGSLAESTVVVLTPEGVGAVVAAAEAAGLSDPLEDYGFPTVTDMPSTEFTFDTSGEPATVAVYALSFTEALEDPSMGLSEEQAEARRMLNEFLDMVLTLDGLEDEVMAGPDAYEPEAVAAYIVPRSGTGATIDWPLDDTTGVEVGNLQCILAEGDDVDTLLGLAAGADYETVWMVDGVAHQVLLRPVLPGEEGCPPA